MSLAELATLTQLRALDLSWGSLEAGESLPLLPHLTLLRLQDCASAAEGGGLRPHDSGSFPALRDLRLLRCPWLAQALAAEGEQGLEWAPPAGLTRLNVLSCPGLAQRPPGGCCLAPSSCAACSWETVACWSRRRGCSGCRGTGCGIRAPGPQTCACRSAISRPSRFWSGWACALAHAGRGGPVATDPPGPPLSMVSRGSPFPGGDMLLPFLLCLRKGGLTRHSALQHCFSTCCCCTASAPRCRNCQLWAPAAGAALPPLPRLTHLSLLRCDLSAGTGADLREMPRLQDVGRCPVPICMLSAHDQ